VALILQDRRLVLLDRFLIGLDVALIGLDLTLVGKNGLLVFQNLLLVADYSFFRHFAETPLILDFEMEKPTCDARPRYRRRWSNWRTKYVNNGIALARPGREILAPDFCVRDLKESKPCRYSE
jgi:hypothetical protein